MKEKKYETNLKGTKHFFSAFKWSMQGFKSTFRGESAFRQELLFIGFLIPLAFYLGKNKLEILLLLIPLFIILIVELLNTSIESAVDRFGDEYHELSGRAKDIGSSAVFLSIAMAVFVWFLILF